jgi:non-specific serine/threonine protein kinase/serine/threonine-protein kinase
MAVSTSPPPDPPDKIGPYKLLELLGEGGMGEVWLAEQTEPVHRRVALKLIKLGMDTRQVVARFEAERQALAVMDHPGIAQVFDGGATDDGRPYFVMELVRGVPLNEYCDTHRLSTEERIRLFVDVCHAVQHAHHKGVIHRDLKPSNILVAVKDDEAVVKIIDFGIAKALGHDLTDRTLVTRIGQIVGTPEYMSPEQAEMSGLDVDTRTDVYALGVILYELLVGALPFDFSAKADEAIRHAIRETEIPRPSTKLTSLQETRDTIARYRRTTVEALRRELRTDLDWIILKAMEKDRTRRYDTANGLALDLDRHLKDEPVLARAPSAGYRVTKFVRRHRMGVAAGAAIAAALVLGLTFATVGMVRAQRAELRAEAEAEAAKQVSDFLVELFAVSDPSEARGNTITAREVLDRGAERIRAGLEDQPEMQARMMEVIGRVYMGLGLYRDAGPLLEEATRLRRSALGNESAEVAESLNSLAENLLFQGQPDTAASLAEEAVSISERTLGPNDPLTANRKTLLAWALQWLGRFDEAQTYLEEALATQEEVLGPDHVETAYVLYRLGWQHRLLGDYEAARECYERAIPVVEAQRGSDDPRLASYLADLGVVQADLGDDSAATESYRRALAIREKALGPDHLLVAQILNNLGILEWEAGRLDEAQAYYERSLQIQESAFGPQNPRVADVLNNLGLLHQAKGEYATARDTYERALAIREQALGPDDGAVASVLSNLGYLLRYVGDFASARPLLERALSIHQANLGPDHPDLSVPLVNLGIMAADMGNYEEARQYFQRNLSVLEGAFEESHPKVADALRFLTSMNVQMGDYAAAEALLERWRRSDPDAPGPLYEGARIRWGQGDREGADSLFTRWLDAMAAESGRESPDFAHDQARVRASVGDKEGALELLQTALDRGYSDPWMTRNREFESLFGDPRFQRMVEEVRVRAGIAEMLR